MKKLKKRPEPRTKMVSLQKPLSWKAVHRGLIYCAPACGLGCTMAQHDAAWHAGDALRRTLNRTTKKLWTTKVWENLGWHYSAISSCGQMKVHNDMGSKTYTAFFGEGDIGGRWCAQATSPHKAVADAVRMAQDSLNAIADIMNKWKQS